MQWRCREKLAGPGGLRPSEIVGKRTCVRGVCSFLTPTLGKRPQSISSSVWGTTGSPAVRQGQPAHGQFRMGGVPLGWVECLYVSQGADTCPEVVRGAQWNGRQVQATEQLARVWSHDRAQLQARVAVEGPPRKLEWQEIMEDSMTLLGW